MKLIKKEMGKNGWGDYYYFTSQDRQQCRIIHFHRSAGWYADYIPAEAENDEDFPSVKKMMGWTGVKRIKYHGSFDSWSKREELVIKTKALGD